MNNTEITVFSNADFGTIRTATDEASGKVLFCGADVAKALGYTNPSKALSEHCKEKGITKRYTLTNGGNQALTYIDEGNVYRLITHSKLPSAEKFERWVFDEVLPTIHKHGAYMTEQTLQKALTSPDFLIQLATQLKAEREQKEQLEIAVKAQAQQIAELQPKSDYCDTILSCNGVMQTNIIAKDYGKSAIWLNRYLHSKGVQYNMDGVWLLYQKYADKGYTVTKTVPYTNPYSGAKEFNVHTYWTQKGRLFIYNLLKADGILPLIERTDFDDAET